MSLRIVLTHVYSWPEVRRGGERHLHELASALCDAGHDVSVLSTANRSGRGLVLGVDTRWLVRRRLLHRRFGEAAEEVAFGVQALAALSCRSADVWHAFGTADAAAAATLSRLRPRLRSVYTELGIPDRAYRESRPDARLHDLVARRIGAYVCYSHAAGESLRSGYGRAPAVIPGGVDLRRFHVAPARHPVPALLMSGKLDEPRKNLGLFLAAAAALRAEEPELEVWLAGPGDPGPAIAAAPAAVRDAVVHFGSLPDDELIDRCGRAWVMVHPAELEAFGMVLVEALACGTPIVGLDRWGPSEIVQPGIGCRAEPNVESLADACRRALSLAREDGIADRCRAAAEPYDWRGAIVPRVEQVYDTLIRR